VPIRPHHHRLARELRTVVRPDHLRLAPQRADTIKDPRQVRGMMRSPKCLRI
jgi:hypothetical protein